MINFASFKILGIPIAATSLQSTADAILTWSEDHHGRYIGVRDVASLVTMSEIPELLTVAQNATINVPDGMPLVWVGKYWGFSIERTCGPDLMDLVCSDSPKTRLKHFFYGGKEGVAEKLAEVFRHRAPGIEIVGTFCPPFRPLTTDEDTKITQMIRDSGADVVWVGISSPKQDVWMYEHVNALPQTLIGVGAAFNFHSGEVKRAPKWMQLAGLEWLHRFMIEPRRLWRRYLFQVPKFLFYLAFSPSGTNQQ